MFSWEIYPNPENFTQPLIAMVVKFCMSAHSTLPTPLYLQYTLFTVFSPTSCHLSFQVLSIPSWPPRTSVNIFQYLPGIQEYCFNDCRKHLQFSVHCSSLCSQEKVSPLSFGLSVSGSIWCYTLWYIFFFLSC